MEHLAGLRVDDHEGEDGKAVGSRAAQEDQVGVLLPLRKRQSDHRQKREINLVIVSSVWHLVGYRKKQKQRGISMPVWTLWEEKKNQI